MARSLRDEVSGEAGKVGIRGQGVIDVPDDGSHRKVGLDRPCEL